MKELAEELGATELETVVTRADSFKCLHALNLYQMPPQTTREYAALSYPGSGSKWIFEMVQYVTGIKDFQLWMEHEVTYKKDTALLTKSHHQRAERYMKPLSSKLLHKGDRETKFSTTCHACWRCLHFCYCNSNN